MNKKTTDIVAYLSWVGLLIAYVMGDRKASRFHLNQSLVIWLAMTLLGIIGNVFGWIPLLGGLAKLVVAVGQVFAIVCWFIGIIAAVEGEEKSVPVLGEVHLL